MAMIEFNKDPSKRELKIFGILFLIFWGIVGAVFYREAPEVSTWIWAVAAIILAVYVLVPASRRYVYLGWMYAALPIGWTVSFLLLVALYYLVVTPIGLGLRLLGKDPMRRELDASAKTYWIERKPVTDPSSYFKQF